jgi:hypothetical protein
LNLGLTASGDYLALLRVCSPVGHVGTGYLTTFAQFFKKNGAVDQLVDSCPQKKIFPMPGEWATVPYFINIPANLGATGINLIVFANDLSSGQEVYVDDYLLYKVPEGAPYVGGAIAGGSSVTIGGIDTDAVSVSLFVNGVTVANAYPASLSASCCLPPTPTIASVQLTLPAGQVLTAGQTVVAREVPADLPNSYYDSTPLVVPGRIVGDLDMDGDVDANDVQMMRNCVSRNGIPASPACTVADLDGDGDVDQADFGQLQRCYAGDRQPITNATCLR